MTVLDVASPESQIQRLARVRDRLASSRLIGAGGLLRTRILDGGGLAALVVENSPISFGLPACRPVGPGAPVGLVRLARCARWALADRAVAVIDARSDLRQVQLSMVRI